MIARLVIGVAVLGGCGRFGFDPTAERTADAPVDTPVDAFSVPGLVAYFPFDDDPTDGVDNRALGSPLALCSTSCPMRVTGRNGTGTAYQFNGTSDAIRFPDQPSLHVQTGTVAFWVRLARLPTLPDEFMVLVAKPFGLSNENSWEVLLHENGTIDFGGGGDSAGNGGYAGTTWTTATNTWVHVALTWGTTIRLYLDGGVVATLADPGRTVDLSPVYVGADFDNTMPVAHTEGALDEVYLFSSALTAAEIGLLAAP